MIAWNKAGANNYRSYYLAISGMIPLRSGSKYLSYLVPTLGVGNGYYLSESRVSKNILNDENKGLGVFGGIALNIVSSVNFLASYNGQNLGAGLSWGVFPFLTIGVSALDLLSNPGDGVRFSGSLSSSYNF